MNDCFLNLAVLFLISPFLDSLIGGILIIITLIINIIIILISEMVLQRLLFKAYIKPSLDEPETCHYFAFYRDTNLKDVLLFNFYFCPSGSLHDDLTFAVRRFFTKTATEQDNHWHKHYALDSVLLQRAAQFNQLSIECFLDQLVCSAIQSIHQRSLKASSFSS